MSDQIHKRDSLVCYHCSSQNLSSDLVKAELGGQQRIFVVRVLPEVLLKGGFCIS